MSITTILATTLAAGVLGAGAAMSPLATADDDNRGPWQGHGMHGRADDSSWAGQGMGMGSGQGRGWGNGPQAGPGQGLRMHDGDCLLGDASVGELTEQQASTLAHLAEEEKLSHDLYVVLAESSQDPRFDRVAVSETHHLAALRTLMSRYDVEDPTVGLEAGKFASSDVAHQYQDYLDRGTASPEAALAVARQVERRDITDLEAATRNLDAPDLERVYEHLADASRMHLEAFGG